LAVSHCAQVSQIHVIANFANGNNGGVFLTFPFVIRFFGLVADRTKREAVNDAPPLFEQCGHGVSPK
jgi:hypothetical protein